MTIRKTVAFVGVEFNSDVPGRMVHATDLDGVTQYQSSPTADDALLKQICSKIVANIETGAPIELTIDGHLIVKDQMMASAAPVEAPPKQAVNLCGCGIVALGVALAVILAAWMSRRRRRS